jgi:hypothetical protein
MWCSSNCHLRMPPSIQIFKARRLEAEHDPSYYTHLQVQPDVAFLEMFGSTTGRSRKRRLEE